MSLEIGNYEQVPTQQDDIAKINEIFGTNIDPNILFGKLKPDQLNLLINELKSYCNDIKNGKINVKDSENVIIVLDRIIIGLEFRLNDLDPKEHIKSFSESVITRFNNALKMNDDFNLPLQKERGDIKFESNEDGSFCIISYGISTRFHIVPMGDEDSHNFNVVFPAGDGYDFIISGHELSHYTKSNLDFFYASLINMIVWLSNISNKGLSLLKNNKISIQGSKPFALNPLTSDIDIKSPNSIDTFVGRINDTTFLRDLVAKRMIRSLNNQDYINYLNFRALNEIKS